jgi:hypothetical protein
MHNGMDDDGTHNEIQERKQTTFAQETVGLDGDWAPPTSFFSTMIDSRR